MGDGVLVYTEIVESKGKDQFIQMIRGVSMICVVLIHSKTGMQSSGAEQVYWVILRQLINFAVPMFFFISGYYANKSLRKIGGYWKRIRKLLIPYLVWTLFYIVVDGGFSGLNVSDVTKDILFGLSSQQMYFIIVLIELTLVTPLLINTSKSKFKYVLLSVSFLYLLIVYYQEFSFNEVHYAIGRNLIPWMVFYYLGILMANHNIRMKIPRTTIVCIITIALAMAESLIILLRFNKPDFAASQLKVSSYLLAIAAIFLVEYFHKIHRDASRNWISMIGDCSYGLFYVHPFVIKLENAVARRIGIYDISLPIYEFGQCAITVVICFAIVYIIKRIDKENKWRWMIGF